MRARIFALGSILLIRSFLAGAAWGAPADPSRADPLLHRYALLLSQSADSLLRSTTPGPEGAWNTDSAARLWERAELEALAERLREQLVRAGAYEATVRLSLVEGSGSEPGAARLWVAATAEDSLTSSAAAPAAASRVSASRAVPVFTSADSSAFGEASVVFARATSGRSTPEAIAAGMEALRDEAVARGHYAAAVSIDSMVPASDGMVAVHLRLRAGPAARFESLELPGAEATRPGSASAIAGLKTGRTVTRALLAEARERLLRSDLFVSVGEPRVLPGTDAAHARVVIPVQESSASRFEGALGIAPGEGLTGNLDLGLGNIAGTGRSAGARWVGLGNGQSLYGLRYREPALLGRPIDASFVLDADVAESLYTETRWSLAFGARPSSRSRAELAVARTGSVYGGLYRGSSETWSVRGGLGWDGLAPALNPARGFAAGIELTSGSRREALPGVPESKRGLLVGHVSVASALSLGGARALYASARAERVSLGEGGFPVEELRYLGGSEGLRGHRDHAFAGNSILALTLEHRWIVDPRGGRAFLFLDGGRHELDRPLATGGAAPGVPSAPASLARTELSDGWELGYGAGLQTRLASGLMSLTFGLRPGAALRESTIHLRYGSTW